MDVLRTGVSMLGLYDHAPVGPQTPEQLLPRAISLTAKVGVIIAYFHRARQGKSLPPIRTDLDEAAHFLYLINGETPGPEAVKTLDLAYVLHADHGFNASTFSALVTTSTLSDIYSAVTTAIGSLKGPLHGGANEAVIHMLAGNRHARTRSTPGCTTSWRRRKRSWAWATPSTRCSTRARRT